MRYKPCKDGIKVCVECAEPRKCTEYFSAGTKNGKVYTRRTCKYCYNETKKVYKRKNKAWLRELKDNAACKKCGYSKKTHNTFNSRALQFHHKDDNKEFEISNGTNWGLSKKRIQKEIDKCDILCARCHVEVHYN